MTVTAAPFCVGTTWRGAEGGRKGGGRNPGPPFRRAAYGAAVSETALQRAEHLRDRQAGAVAGRFRQSRVAEHDLLKRIVHREVLHDLVAGLGDSVLATFGVGDDQRLVHLAAGGGGDRPLEWRAGCSTARRCWW